MKVRRILALVLSAALAVTALTACTSAKDEASQKSADKQTTTLSYDTVKIGVIHIGNPADGSGYTYAHDQGIVGMQKELGLKDDQIVRKNNVSDSDPAATETAIRECIEVGCNFILRQIVAILFILCLRHHRQIGRHLCCIGHFFTDKPTRNNNADTDDTTAKKLG